MHWTPFIPLPPSGIAAVAAVPHGHHYNQHHHHSRSHPHIVRRDSGNRPVCTPISPILHNLSDLAAKIRPEGGVCAPNEVLTEPPSEANIQANGACCAKSGYCGYGEKYCGKNGKSPNDVCWSNCDAHAECGRFAELAGKACPLNVCCSAYGFCGMTEEFCAVTDDEETSCQSNCEQPGSGGRESDAQKRVIGYYEAWNYRKQCIKMGFNDIPVGSLTHLYYSFGYIEPESYDIVPMNDGGDSEPVSSTTFTQITDLKRKNPALKVVLALGGWTFNDNHTVWQPVLSDMVSTADKRSVFIIKLIVFLKRHGFDGVDFDWEYPGAGDRGGHPDDGENFTKLLEELRSMAFLDGSQANGWEISFTAPTSYWYLRHFDLKASVEASTYVNLMAYDLHGIWDLKNPIGSQVLAHTNLTEINNALDLLWRNNIDPGKVNMGLGFYGRSFQLADPACNKPGCLFKGGATPGPCTDESGILSFAEIMDIKDKYNLTPEYDQVNAVKYITWNGDQWVSFDDQVTFQQKIEFANSLGIGGLLIWAIDLDTPQLDALSGVIYPERLNFRADQSSGADNWEDVAEGWCYSTPCGTSGCKPGYIKTTSIRCGGWNILEDPEGTQDLCCPLQSAPDISTWEIAVMSSTWGGGGHPCTDGRKFLCCPTQVQQPDCRWTKCNEQCSSKENELTWSWGGCGGDNYIRFCCNKAQKWENCAWHGQPKSCYDNHCDTGVGETCGHQLSRQRSFRCDLPDDSSPFLPVPLEYLFDDPPPADKAHTTYELEVDPTWGGTTPDLPDWKQPEDPANEPFCFVVMTNGSRWDVFDCIDGITVGEHTVRMLCVDSTENSNCHKVHLGHGAPGTIVQMPPGCGPGKYATTPSHLTRRGITSHDTIYDLTFDYDFRRVPKDLGETQIRIDYSNDHNYWDGIVDRAADSKRRKRDLTSMGGNHRRWLEEGWRDDMHLDAIPTEDLHKRWFGSDVIDWLRELLGTVEHTVMFGHTYSEDFVVKLVDQTLTCPNVDAYLDIHAETHVEATLDSPIDLSNSYLYFRSRGEVSATFVVDGALLFAADKFGAAFSVPGIVTIGTATLGVQFESKVKLGGWDIQQTYPIPSDEFKPELDKRPSKDGIQTLSEPEFKYGLSLSGYISAHIKPTITFGIAWNQNFIPLDDCKVQLTADGHVTFHAEAQTGSDGTSFCYGVDAGADIYTTISAPEAISWALPRTPYHLFPVDDVQIYPPGTQPACWTPETKAQRSIEPSFINSTRVRRPSHGDLNDAVGAHSISKRAQVWGPLIPNMELDCPMADTGDDLLPCPACGASSLARRQNLGSCTYNPEAVHDESVCPREALDMQRRGIASREGKQNGGVEKEVEPRALVERSDQLKTIAWKYDKEPNLKPLEIFKYPTCGDAIYKPISRSAEHVYELQTVHLFFQFLQNDSKLPQGYKAASNAWVSERLLGLDRSTNGRAAFVPTNAGWKKKTLWEEVFSYLGSVDKKEGLVIAEERINPAKNTFFGSKNPPEVQHGKRGLYQKQPPQRKNRDIWSIFVDASKHIEATLKEFDEAYWWATGATPDSDALQLPKRDDGEPKPGLRGLYCYWIDTYLGTIEQVGRKWRDKAEIDYRRKYQGTKEGTPWLKQFDFGGFTSDKFSFRSNGQAYLPGQKGPWQRSNFRGLWSEPAGPFCLNKPLFCIYGYWKRHRRFGPTTVSLRGASDDREIT
ncbi:glycosyl hydrolases family 18-domain-containing protein [Aspergillus granulosus]|uniref:chitinase n=1 Tax=Aspergillus granulosus TaxID=176169 RepID=A0ABR4GXG6_9EURO